MRAKTRLAVFHAAAGAVLGALAALAASSAPAQPRRTIDVSRALDAGAPALPAPSVSATPPDPPPLIERRQWVFDLRWDRGDVWLLGVEMLDLPAPQAAPREMGRFALELFEGAALVERVRFDFPMLGAPEGDAGGWSSPPSLVRKLRTRIGVVFPATARGNRLELLDRATGHRWSIPWPPQRSPSNAPEPRPKDAGTPSD